MECNCIFQVEIVLASPTTPSDDCVLGSPKSMFWETQGIQDVVNNKLKFVTMQGFTGKELELNFAKLLITRAYMMKKLYVICDSTIVEEAKDLLSLQRASNNLSILLE